MDIVTSGTHGVMGGVPLFIDVTCVSPVSGRGEPRLSSADDDGCMLQDADRRNRVNDYPDIESAPNATLICAGCETYGRFSETCLHLVNQLAKFRASSSPDILKKSIQRAFSQRWWAILGIAVQRAVAENILNSTADDLGFEEASSSDLYIIDVLDLNRD